MANHRSFSIAMPADTAVHNLLTLALAQTGAIPTNGIFPNPCSSLRITAALANAGSTITVQDAATTDGGQALGAGDQFLRESHRNNINLGEYVLQGSGDSLVFALDVEQN